MKTTLAPALALLLLSACGSSDKPPAKAAPNPGRIAAYGVATGILDQSLARTTAENRAIHALHKLLTPDAVTFEYKAAGGDSSLKMVVPTGEVSHSATELIPVARGWGAKAFGVRTAEALAAIRALPATEVEIEVKHRDAGVALMLAESRALRSVISQATDACANTCSLAGTITVASYEPEFLADGVRLKLAGHAKPGAAKPLKKRQRRAVHRSAAEEHLKLGEWQDLLQTLERAQKLSSRDAGLFGMRGEAEAGLGNLERAIKAFTKAAALDSSYKKRRDEVKAQLEAQKAASPAAAPPK